MFVGCGPACILISRMLIINRMPPRNTRKPGNQALGGDLVVPDGWWAGTG